MYRFCAVVPARLLLPVWLGVSLLLVSGCGGGPDRPETVAVSGTITYNGEPVTGANVTFTPEDGRPATGVTDEKGRFTLTTFDPGDGAVPGNYTITVSKAPEYAEMPDSADEYAVPSDDTSEGGLPSKYADAGKSDLKRTVTADGKNEFQLELTD